MTVGHIWPLQKSGVRKYRFDYWGQKCPPFYNLKFTKMKILFLHYKLIDVMKDTMKKKNLNQQQTSEALQTSIATVNRLVNAKLPAMELPLFIKVCEFTGYHPSKFFTENLK